MPYENRWNKNNYFSKQSKSSKNVQATIIEKKKRVRKEVKIKRKWNGKKKA